MIKLLAMDVDNTLAKLNKSILKSTIEHINRIKEKGTKIMMISGKPVAYLAGISRQIGINDLLLSGENGVSIHIGGEFPPKKVYEYHVTKFQKNVLREIKDSLNNKLKDKIWFQPNEVQITAFFFDEDTKMEVVNIVKKIFLKSEVSNELKYYIHSDCIDIVPKQISKGNAIKMYMEKYNIKSSEVITIGDGVNDISMFKVSDESILIGDSYEINTTYKYEDIDSAILFVEKKIEGEE